VILIKPKLRLNKKFNFLKGVYMAIEDEIRKVMMLQVKEAADKLSTEVKNSFEKLDMESQSISLQIQIDGTKQLEKNKIELSKHCDKEFEKLKQEVEKLKSDHEKSLAQIKESFIKRIGGKSWFSLK
jgi:exonuclease VII small subunit